MMAPLVLKVIASSLVVTSGLVTFAHSVSRAAIVDEPVKVESKSALDPTATYTRFVAVLTSDSPKYTRPNLLDWDSYLASSQQFNNPKVLLEALEKCSAEPFKSPVDYAAPGSQLLPHLSDMSMTGQAALSLLVLSVKQEKWADAKVCIHAVAKLDRDLSTLPWMVETSAGIRLADSFGQVLLGLPKDIAIPEDVRTLCLESITSIRAHRLSALKHSLAFDRDRSISAIMNGNESIYKDAGVDLSAIKKDRAGTCKSLRVIFDNIIAKVEDPDATLDSIKAIVSTHKTAGSHKFVQGVPDLWNRNRSADKKLAQAAASLGQQ